MSDPWQNLERSIIVMDYSKMLIAFVAWNGANIAKEYLVSNYLGKYTNPEKQMQRIVDCWNKVLRNLTPEQIAIIEAEKPGIVAEMRKRLKDLEIRLEFLSRKLAKTKYF